MEIKIAGLSEVFDIIGALFKGVKAAAEIPETEKKIMKDALADTAELIDETLTILKQHLTTVIGELKYGDDAKARRMIFEMGNFLLWEQKYRQFELCDTLRNAAMNLEKKGIFQLKTNISFGDPDTLKQLIWDYIGGEANAARSVGEMLVGLSRKADFDPAQKDEMIESLEAARTELGSWRQKFVDIEIEIRAAIR
ncbi:MAG: hypothetical protein IPN08_04200 [Bacteroidales bacterium]|nr:hypothetical protein [Bacteroidales bacterium]MBK9356585.1 hypothetical protein [Bacteroidales bacterium]